MKLWQCLVLILFAVLVCAIVHPDDAPPPWDTESWMEHLCGTEALPEDTTVYDLAGGGGGGGGADGGRGGFRPGPAPRPVIPRPMPKPSRYSLQAHG